MVGEELIEDAERSKRLRTTKTNENITRVAAALKDECRASFEYIYNDGEAMIYVYHYAHFCHIDSGSE